MELISQKFSCTGKEKEIAATSQCDFSFSLWEGTAWLLLCSSYTSCGRHWQCSVMLWDIPSKAFQELGPLQALQGTLHLCGTTWTRQHLGLESEDMEQPQSKALEQ